MPPVPRIERESLARRDLGLRVLKVALPPLALVLAVLGSSIAGTAAPTEAASMGALGSIVVVAAARRLSMRVLLEVMRSTMRTPIFAAAKVDMVWLAMLITVNLQSSFLTPPFGWALFFLRGVAPPEITTRHIYTGIIPFVGLQLLGIVLVFLFPPIATWLPKAIGW